MTVTDFPANAQAAHCRRDGIDPEVFFPSRDASDGRIQEARKICAGCPLNTECLDYALRNNVQGVWAGTTEQQRGAIRVKRGIKAQPMSFGIQQSNTEQIRRMYRQGRTVAHIADRLDISEQAVRQSIRAYEDRRAERGEPPISDPSAPAPCPDGCGSMLLPGSLPKHRKGYCTAAVAS